MNEKQLIEKIHGEFDSAEDRLLKEANYILSSQNTSVIDVSERLKAIGFVNTPTAKKGAETKQQLVKSRNEAELIEYCKLNYPFMKFLTEAELNRICNKYKLIYAPAENYIKEVPEKNLRDIEIAQPLKSSDIEPIFYTYDLEFYGYVPNAVRDWFKSFKSPNPIQGDNRLRDCCPIKYDGEYLYRSNGLTINKTDRSVIFIAAPETHFNTQGLVKKGLGFFNVLKTEVKDPIVFRYVKGGVQVITKWGLEASDPSLVVPALN